MQFTELALMQTHRDISIHTEHVLREFNLLDNCHIVPAFD